jgi:hypothetical protein
MKTYTLESRLMYWLFVLVIPVLGVVAGATWIWIAVSRSESTQMIVFGILWFIAMLWGGYRQSTMPHTIQVTDTGTIRFVGILKTANVEPSDVISVKELGGTFVELKHVGGKIVLLHRFTGFHEFLTELKRVNPNVLMRGV